MIMCSFLAACLLACLPVCLYVCLLACQGVLGHLCWHHAQLAAAVVLNGERGGGGWQPRALRVAQRCQFGRHPAVQCGRGPPGVGRACCEGWVVWRGARGGLGMDMGTPPECSRLLGGHRVEEALCLPGQQLLLLLCVRCEHSARNRHRCCCPPTPSPGPAVAAGDWSPKDWHSAGARCVCSSLCKQV